MVILTCVSLRWWLSLASRADSTRATRRRRRRSCGSTRAWATPRRLFLTGSPSNRNLRMSRMKSSSRERGKPRKSCSSDRWGCSSWQTAAGIYESASVAVSVNGTGWSHKHTEHQKGAATGSYKESDTLLVKKGLLTLKNDLSQLDTAYFWHLLSWRHALILLKAAIKQ